MSNNTPSGPPTNPLHQRPTVDTAGLSRLAGTVQTLMWIVAVGLMAVGVGVNPTATEWFLNLWRKNSSPATQSTASNDEIPAPSAGDLTDADVEELFSHKFVTPKNPERETRPVPRQVVQEKKQVLRDSIRRAERAEEIIQQCLAGIDAWQAETKALLSNEVGRSLAADANLLREAQVIVDFKHTPREDVKILLASVQDLLRDWKTEEGSSSPVAPSTDALARLAGYVTEAKKVLGEYDEANSELKILTERAQQTTKPGEKTLATALKDLKSQQNIESLTAKQKKFDETRAEIARMEADGESKRLLLEAAEKKAKQEEELENQQVRAEKDRLKRLAHSDEVKRHLGSLFAPGRDQPLFPVSAYNLAPAVNQVRTVEKGPVSLTRIRNANWLSDNPDALTFIAIFSARQAQTRDRPPLPIPGNPNLLASRQASAETLNFLKEVQRLLKELGPILVEEKLLAP